MKITCNKKEIKLIGIQNEIDDGSAEALPCSENEAGSGVRDIC